MLFTIDKPFCLSKQKCDNVFFSIFDFDYVFVPGRNHCSEKTQNLVGPIVATKLYINTVTCARPNSMTKESKTWHGCFEIRYLRTHSQLFDALLHLVSSIGTYQTTCYVRTKGVCGLDLNRWLSWVSLGTLKTLHFIGSHWDKPSYKNQSFRNKWLGLSSGNTRDTRTKSPRKIGNARHDTTPSFFLVWQCVTQHFVWPPVRLFSTAVFNPTPGQYIT